jgi:hypothetical protein
MREKTEKRGYWKEREKKKKVREKKDVDQGRGARGAEWRRMRWCGPVGLGWAGTGRGCARIELYNTYFRLTSNWIQTIYNQLKNPLKHG